MLQCRVFIGRSTLVHVVLISFANMSKINQTQESAYNSLGTCTVITPIYLFDQCVHRSILIKLLVL